MGVINGPNFVTNGLVFYLDPSNINCYPSFGLTCTDISGSDLGATLSNGATFSQLNLGTFVFDSGSNQYIDTNYIQSSVTWTYNCWFLLNNIPIASYQTILMLNSPTYILMTIDANSRIPGLWTTDGLGSAGPGGAFGTTFSYNQQLNASQWYNWTIVREGNSVVGGYKAFLNGQFSGTANSGGNPNYSTDLWIGSRSDQSSQGLNGKIGHVSIYNRALSASEILQNYLTMQYKYRNPWTPAQLTTALLWLDASDSSTITQSGGTVSQWNDKSGNGNNMTQTTPANQPIYQPTGNSTGGAALSFNGTTQFINGNIVSPTQLRNFTSLNVFMVLQSTIAGAPEANSIQPFGLFRNTSTNIAFLWSSVTGLLTGESITLIRNANDRLGSSTYTRAANTMQIFNSQNATTGTTLFADGSSINLNLSNNMTTSTDTSPLAAALGNDNFTVFGTGGPDNIPSPAGKVSEVLVFNANLSTTNRQLVEGYLAWKWGLQGNLPSNHPYKNQAPYL
jgi:hypothetical protein